MSGDEEEMLGKGLTEVERARGRGVFGELEGNLIAAMEAARADGDIEEVGRLEKLVSDIETMRISDEEAGRLGRLGERLRESRGDVGRARDGKIEADPNLSEPNVAVPDANDVNLGEANSPESE
jgi:hypothetical protein